jgi:hypothetical protein
MNVDNEVGDRTLIAARFNVSVSMFNRAKKQYNLQPVNIASACRQTGVDQEFNLAEVKEALDKFKQLQRDKLEFNKYKKKKAEVERILKNRGMRV